MRNPFRYFNSSPEVIRLAVMMYIRYPLSLRQGEDLLFERGIDICHETVRFWWNRFGLLFAAAIRRRRVRHRSYSLWRCHLDEMLVKSTARRTISGVRWITKHGDGYIRRLMVHGARTALRWRRAKPVAMANKTARVAWVLLSYERIYEPTPA